MHDDKFRFDFTFDSQLLDMPLTIRGRKMKPRVALANVHTFAPIAGPLLDLFGKLSPDDLKKIGAGDVGKLDVKTLGAGISAALGFLTPGFVEQAVSLLFAGAQADEPRENGSVTVPVTPVWLDQHMDVGTLAKAIGVAYVENYRNFTSGLGIGGSSSPR